MDTKKYYVIYELYHSKMHGSSTPAWMVSELLCDSEDEAVRKLNDPLLALYRFPSKDVADRACVSLNRATYTSLQEPRTKPVPVFSSHFTFDGPVTFANPKP